jgi:hypothetical protein
MVSELVHNTTQHCMSIWNNLGTLQESFSELWRWILLIFAGALTSRCSGRDHVRGRRHQRLARRTERRVFPRDRAAGSRTASSAPWSKTTRRGGGSTDCRDAAALQFPFLFPNCTCRLQFSLHCLFAGSCTVLQWDIITNKMKNLKKKRRTNVTPKIALTRIPACSVFASLPLCLFLLMLCDETQCRTSHDLLLSHCYYLVTDVWAPALNPCPRRRFATRNPLRHLELSKAIGSSQQGPRRGRDTWTSQTRTAMA